MALIANIGLTIRAFRHRALLPHRGNLRSAHAARLTSFHCRLRCSAFFQVTLVAQILLPFRFVFTRSPLRARRQGAATPTFQVTTRLQTVSSLPFVTSSAQILVFVQFTLVPASSGVRFIADETLPARILHVFFRPTREAKYSPPYCQVCEGIARSFGASCSFLPRTSFVVRSTCSFSRRCRLCRGVFSRAGAWERLG